MIEAFARAHRAGQDQFNEGDFERAFAGLAPDVEWHLLLSWAVEAQDFIDAGHGRVIVHQRGTGAGRTTNISDTRDFFQVWELREDGLVARIHEYETQDEALAAAEATNH